MLIEINFVSMFGGDLEKYHRWNIDNTARIIARKPEEYEIELAVYKIHKEILKKTGHNLTRLEEEDDELVELIKKIGGANLN